MFTITPYNTKRSIAPRGALTLLDSLSWADQLFQDNWDRILHSDHPAKMAFDEKSKAYTIEFDVAGYKKGDIKIEVDERDSQKIVVTAQNEKRGIATHSFYVSDADPNKIEAKLEDGVLTISVPQKPEKIPKQIPILGG